MRWTYWKTTTPHFNLFHGPPLAQRHVMWLSAGSWRHDTSTGHVVPPLLGLALADPQAAPGQTGSAVHAETATGGRHSGIYMYWAIGNFYFSSIGQPCHVQGSPNNCVGSRVDATYANVYTAATVASTFLHAFPPCGSVLSGGPVAHHSRTVTARIQ